MTKKNFFFTCRWFQLIWIHHQCVYGERTNSNNNKKMIRKKVHKTSRQNGQKKIFIIEPCPLYAESKAFFPMNTLRSSSWSVCVCVLCCLEIWNDLYRSSEKKTITTTIIIRSNIHVVVVVVDDAAWFDEEFFFSLKKIL